MTTQVLDREDVEIYQLMLMAMDEGNIPLSSFVPTTVTIVDINDNPPVFNETVMNLSVRENTNGTTIAEIIVSLSIVYVSSYKGINIAAIFLNAVILKKVCIY